MKKASEYRASAEECRRLAARTQDQDHKAMLANMAETWESLARERVGKMARKKRIAAYETPPTRE